MRLDHQGAISQSTFNALKTGLKVLMRKRIGAHLRLEPTPVLCGPRDHREHIELPKHTRAIQV